LKYKKRVHVPDADVIVATFYRTQCSYRILTAVQLQREAIQRTTMLLV